MGVAIRKPGRHFFANPGPTNIPDSVLRAMDRNSIDFVEDEFLAVYDEARAGLKRILLTEHDIFFYSATGHGAWEATMVNLLSAGDKILMIGGGYFSISWANMCRKFGIEVDMLDVDWRSGAEIAAIEARLKADIAHEIKAICAIHNETSTSVVLPISSIRGALDAAQHPALLLADTISSLGCFEFKTDEWGVDVVVGGSQKGLMLPTGLAFSAVSPKALTAHKRSTLPKFYFDWSAMLERRFKSFTGSVPIVPFFGMVEAIKLMEQEGLEQIWARHHRLASAVRAAVRIWGSGNQGPELYNQNPTRYSDSVTTILLPPEHNADHLRKLLLDKYNLSTGGGLATLSGKVFRIGHMGDLNEAMVLGTIATVELAMAEMNLPFSKGGINAAMGALAQ